MIIIINYSSPVQAAARTGRPRTTELLVAKCATLSQLRIVLS